MFAIFVCISGKSAYYFPQLINISTVIIIIISISDRTFCSSGNDQQRLLGYSIATRHHTSAIIHEYLHITVHIQHIKVLSVTAAYGKYSCCPCMRRTCVRWISSSTTHQVARTCYNNIEHSTHKATQCYRSVWGVLVLPLYAKDLCKMDVIIHSSSSSTHMLQ